MKRQHEPLEVRSRLFSGHVKPSVPFLDSFGVASSAAAARGYLRRFGGLLLTQFKKPQDRRPAGGQHLGRRLQLGYWGATEQNAELRILLRCSPTPRYSISGLVCPLSQVLIGRNVWGPWVWQAHRFHRGLGTSTRPNTVLTEGLPESLVVYRLRQRGQARRCSNSSRACWATTKSCTA